MQEIIVMLILLAIVFISGRKMYHYFNKLSKGGSPCDCCSSACTLKDQVHKNTTSCDKNHDSSEKTV